MKITSFSLNNFAPEEFFGGAKSVSMNGPKFSKSDRTMKAFSFVERKNYIFSSCLNSSFSMLTWNAMVFAQACSSIITITISSKAIGA